MLGLEAIEAGYGRVTVLFGISFDVAEGEAVALTGSSGAGKSTLIKTVAGLIRPSAGRVDFCGAPISGMEPYRIARQGIGYVPEGRRIFSDLTVSENLETGRRSRPEQTDSWTMERVYELFPALEKLRDRRGGTLSGGEQQMLAVARTLMGNPSLLLLDEPAEGLAPLVVADLLAALNLLKTRGLALLFADQSAGFAGELADRTITLERGRLASDDDRKF